MDSIPIQLLIVDDSIETCDILENYFALTQEISVCCVAHDGNEALFCISQHHPDVVLLDLIMPKLDGLAVLERFGQIPLSKRPRIIVTSAVGQESFTSTALSLGADYYMIKPYDLADLHSRICTATMSGSDNPTPQNTVLQGNEELEANISRILLDLGIPPHMLGFRYCCAAMLLLLQENRPQSIVKDIYTRIAENFSTTPECVEGAIRKVIRRAWDCKKESICTLTGVIQETPPSNGRFLNNLAQHIRLGTGNRSDSYAV